MKVFLTILFGFIAGIAGGMGLGGGTFLIPLFQFLDYEQTAIQAINLISFLPMAIVALALHFKNGLVKKDGVLWIIIPAAALALLGAWLAKDADIKVLKICFGVLIFAVGIWEIIKSIKQMKKEKQKKIRNNADGMDGNAVLSSNDGKKSSTSAIDLDGEKTVGTSD